MIHKKIMSNDTSNKFKPATLILLLCILEVSGSNLIPQTGFSDALRPMPG
jgi:hypothetical protein